MTIKGPKASDTGIPDDPATLGAGWYALRMWRELRHALLELRLNFPLIGLITFHTRWGTRRTCSRSMKRSPGAQDHWFVREVLLQQGRTLKMIDVTARTFLRSCYARFVFCGQSCSKLRWPPTAPTCSMTPKNHISVSEANE